MHERVGLQREGMWEADDGHDCHLMATNQKTETRKDDVAARQR